MSDDLVGWFELAVAAFLLVSIRIGPAGRSQRRGAVEVAVMVAAAGLGLAAVVSSVRAFRSGELAFARKSR